MMQADAKGGLLVIAAMFIFGSFGIFSRLIHSSVVSILLFYQIIGLAGIFVILLKRSDFSGREHMRSIIVFSVVNMAADASFLAAVRYTSMANAVFLKFTAPVFVLLLSPLLIKEVRERAAIYSFLLAMSGLLLILYPTGLDVNTDVIGVSLGLVAGITLALQIIVMKKLTTKMSIYNMMFYRYLVSTILVGLVFLTVDQGGLNISVLPEIIAFGLLFAVVSSIIHLKGISLTSAQRSSIFGYFEPFTAIVYGVFLLYDIPSVFTIAGGSLIIFSSLIMLLRKKTAL